MGTTGTGTQPSATGPGRPTMLSHAAFISRDTSATHDFYTRILGMDFVGAVLDDSIPSTGEPIPYFHSFFRMGDGSTIAFFEAPELPPPSEESHPAYRTFKHFAMEVASTADVDRWAEWLRANEVDIIGPVDHGIIYSVYLRDPDGNRLEITTPTDPRWNNDAANAAEALREWQHLKDTARAEGRDLASVMADLARERSHRRALGLKD